MTVNLFYHGNFAPEFRGVIQLEEGEELHPLFDSNESWRKIAAKLIAAYGEEHLDVDIPLNWPSGQRYLFHTLGNKYGKIMSALVRAGLVKRRFDVTGRPPKKRWVPRKDK